MAEPKGFDEMAAAVRAARATEKPAAPAPAPGTVKGPTVDWYTLTDEDAPVRWERLRRWVEWVTVRYDIPVSTIPDCWWRHPALVEELSGLHAAHIALFDPQDTGMGALNWHEHFALAQPRLTRAYAGGCANGHREHPPRTWTSITDEDAWTAWTTQGHAH